MSKEHENELRRQLEELQRQQEEQRRQQEARDREEQIRGHAKDRPGPDETDTGGRRDPD